MTKPRYEFLALAEQCGARLTGKPDGSESITIIFTIAAWRAFDKLMAEPIDMVLFCPACGKQHIDAPDDPFYGGMTDSAGFHPRWDNPPHRSHLCHGCGHIWRPADVPTNGVAAIKTKGKADSPISAHAAPAQVVMSVTDDMVSRFLSWPLPRDFHPDCGISFDGRRDDEWNKSKTWPIGTNLLTAIQARQMLEHVLTEPVAAPHVKTAAEMRYDAAHDTSCVGAFARARPGKV